jgi:DNA-binding winged helix-turn-helix (wHTH) protein/tetratricopeptide (TPR) repeat protein
MQAVQRWRFGAIDVDARENRLLREGRAVALSHRAFALLLALLRRPGELVTKAEIFAAAWPGVVVGDAALSQAVRELRVALGDCASAPRYVATVHGLGFRFIGPVEQDVDAAPLSSLSTPLHRLVAREAELARLDAALCAAHGGCRQCVVVVGPAGIGKTALVETFVRRHAGDDGLYIAPGRCIEHYGPGEAHLPILEALEQLSRQLGQATFTDAFSRYAPTWLAHLPWLARTVEGGVRPAAAAHATPVRMLRELAHALDMLAMRRTIVLWLEDLHWCDPSSLEAIEFLAGRRDPSRLLLIGSFRPGDATQSAPPLAGIVLRLAQRGQAFEIALGALDAVEVGRYLRQRFGTAAALPIEALAAFIHARTQGNALFVVSTVDDLVRRGALVEGAGGWRLRDGIAGLDDSLPDTLRRLVEAELGRLCDEDARLVQAAAVVGPAFSVAALAAAAQSDPADVEDRCARLARHARLLEHDGSAGWPDGTVTASFRFRHALVWQGIDERVPPGRRAEWQRRIATRQEQAHGEQCAAIASELAMRFEAAHDVEKSLHYLALAAKAALSRCAYAEGIDHLRGALRIVTALRPERRARAELDLLLPLGAALMGPQGYGSAEVAEVYRRALKLCEVCGQPGDLMRALSGDWNVALQRADMARAHDAAGQMLLHAQLHADERARADAHAKLGQTLLHMGDLAAARKHLERALAGCGRVHERRASRLAPRVAAWLAYTLWYAGAPTRASEVGEDALERARRAGSPHSTAFALGYVGTVRAMRGDYDRLRPMVDEQLAISQDYGLSYWQHFAEYLGGVVTVHDGRASEGIETMGRAIVRMQATGARVGVPYLLCMLADTQLADGRIADARATLDNASQVMGDTGNALGAAEIVRLDALLLRAEGDTPAVRRRCRAALESALDTTRRQHAGAIELRVATSLAGLLKDEGEAHDAIAVLEPVHAMFADARDTLDVSRANELLAALKSAPRTAGARTALRTPAGR